jgi:hydroxymethylbilane synthase
MWQARHVKALLERADTGLSVELVVIETQGDRVRDQALSQLAQTGFGVFTKEIQAALLDARVDLAVHSLKDLPTIPVPGLELVASPQRGPMGDVFVSRRYSSLAALPDGAVVATSSLRRRSQLLHHRPGLRVVDVRGNVETRLRKLDEQGLDAVLLAEAGLRRLGLERNITEVCAPAWMLPAVGQGALGLECRANDATTREVVSRLNHPPTWNAILAERSFLAALGGGCLVPIGASAEVVGEQLRLRGAVLSAEGSQRVGGEITGPASSPEELGRQLAVRLLADGAGKLLKR